MSRLAELIEELCPDGVEFRRLDELFATRNGYTPSRSDMSAWDSYDIPWFRMEDIRENGGILDSALTYVSSSAVKKGVLFPENSLLVATSATIGAHALITVPHLSNQRFTSLQLKDEYRKHFDYRFLYYYCFVLDAFCLDHVNVSSFPSVDMRAFRSFKFPFVPLAVQREIVRILDQFTTLEAELEAELEARRTQYEHYRNHLLSYESLAACGPVDLIELQDVGVVRMCKRIHKAETSIQGDIPFFKISTFGGTPTSFISAEVYEKYKEKYPYPKQGDLLISAAGTIGQIVRFDGADAYFQDSNIVWLEHDESIVLNRYLYYVYLNTRWTTDGGTIKRLYNNRILQQQICVPPIETQIAIADLLDRFDALVNDISSGLPAEIAARRAQYEHYRDRLLSFPEKAASGDDAS